MIVEGVEVIAFGPIANEQLDLAPGMNVVVGPNESGKSTLHAALYAALCGIRRGRGQPRAEDRAFESAHRPWAGDEWRVRAVVRLEDGRRIELEQDLLNPGRSSARDLVSGRQVTNEILNDGAPDASRWLGLTRRAFLATACVRQAELLAVAQDPSELQQELQRAAASAGRDETAARAIARLNDFRREHVGQDRRGSTKPLHRAREQRRERVEELQRAKREHERVLSLLREAEEAELAARDREQELRALEAALAERQAREAEQTARRVAELADRHREAPLPLVENTEFANGVAGTLERWAALPPAPDLSGPASAELRAELEALPPPPTGDLDLHATVVGARRRYDRARDLLDSLGPEPMHPDPDEVAADDEELRRLREALAAEAPELDPALEQRVAAARARYERAGKRPRLALLAAGGALLVAGIGTLFLEVVLGVALLVGGALLLGWALASARGGEERAAALEELRDAENALGEARFAVEATRRRRREAKRRCGELGIAPEVEAIAGLLGRREAAATAAERHARWAHEHARLSDSFAVAEEALRRAL
ncbi:MAG: AAA family ATPase, partial [Thermoleophilia bacterium]|nr:AAA family ATPase [Gaiellaceae bacterium]MDW8339141.1 AAA family ATPase [Thermoleophilia bacterium]